MDDKLTIVGPEPSDYKRKKSKSSLNIEAFFLMAKYNDRIKKMIFEDREKALKESGIQFTPSEKMLLSKISDKQFKNNLKVFNIPGITKKSLASWTKAASIILLISTITLGVASCMGITPDIVERNSANELLKKEITPDTQIEDSTGDTSTNSQSIDDSTLTREISPDK